MRDLPASPRFVFCATDLTFGANWEFSPASLRRFPGRLPAPARTDFAGDRGGGLVVLSALVRAGALAGHGREISCSGKHRSAYGDHLRDRIELSDGGVYDNLATEPVIKSSARSAGLGRRRAVRLRRRASTALRRLLRYAERGRQPGRRAAQAPVYSARIRAGDFSGAYWNLGDERDAGAGGLQPWPVRGSAWPAFAPTWTTSPRPNSRSW